MKNIIFALFLVCLIPKANALIRLGTGVSAVTEGRVHPLIFGGVDAGDLAFTAYSVGYKSSYSYHSAYQVNFFFNFFPKETFIWGHFVAGAGWGVHFFEKGFQGGPSDRRLKKRNFATGPTIRGLWHYAGPLFIGLEAMYGMRNLGAHILLSTQDTAALIVGFEI
ncbi:MAG: hypothetical protein HOE90_24045 [Bacteriovoracaceae bacterium]|nr:hypothetical protein [Bacteriovoracaceae bacterium]